MSIHSSHILICRTDNIGDVVLTFPIAARLKQMLPGVRISFLCRAYAASVVRFCKDVDQVFEVESVTDNLLRFFKQSGIDTVIMAQPDHDIIQAAFRAGVKHRIGNARQKIYQLIYCNRRIRFSKSTSDLHESQLNFEFLQAYGRRSIPSLDKMPSLYHFQIPTIRDFEVLFRTHAFNLILHAKSNGHGREWPIEYYATLAEMLSSHPDIHLWLTGSAKEGEWLLQHGQALLRRGNVTNVCGRFSLAELTSFIGQADGLIASGTGPLHLSAAIGQRTLGLFPPTRPMHPGRWAPVGRRTWTLCCENSCANCEQITESSCDCMRKITPQHVAEIVQGWLIDTQNERELMTQQTLSATA
ncbi:glycosyltransferase family 9 protein [Ampullimonas aquatilis]|uniref:glycosyltransferase family 9 protein n=1 Tax=Ampullimonas aquatilis TaxID=1341549 RepID=UPI003C77D02A